MPQFSNVTMTGTVGMGPFKGPSPNVGGGMVSRGGQLVVGGAVVGQWGANYGPNHVMAARQNHGKGQQQKKKKNKNKVIESL